MPRSGRSSSTHRPSSKGGELFSHGEGRPRPQDGTQLGSRGAARGEGADEAVALLQTSDTCTAATCPQGAHTDVTHRWPSHRQGGLAHLSLGPGAPHARPALQGTVITGTVSLVLHGTRSSSVLRPARRQLQGLMVAPEWGRSLMRTHTQQRQQARPSHRAGHEAAESLGSFPRGPGCHIEHCRPRVFCFSPDKA